MSCFDVLSALNVSGIVYKKKPTLYIRRIYLRTFNRAMLDSVHLFCPLLIIVTLLPVG